MEDRTTIRERHGIANARRCSMASVANSETQAVTVQDGFGEVILDIGSCTYPAGMTPEQARMLAGQLRSAADRAEADRGSPIHFEEVRGILKHE